MSVKSKLMGKLKELRVVQKRKVKLTSGKTADFYVDLKKAYGSPEILELICKCMEPNLKNATCVAGLGHGGVPLATALSLKNKLKLSLVRDKPRKHGTGAWIDGYVPGKKDKVLIVDDVVTTGASLKMISQAVKRTGAKVIGCAVVVRREDVNVNLALYFVVDVNELR